jgi:hypothetical protein
MAKEYKSLCEWLKPSSLPTKDMSKYTEDKLNSLLLPLIFRSIESNKFFSGTEAAATWLIVTELMDRGIAPNWIDDSIQMLPIQDLELIDLYWLSKNCPKHLTISERWNKCFNPEIDDYERLREMHRIAGLVSYSGYRKQRIMNLNNKQKVCCRYYSDAYTSKKRNWPYEGHSRRAELARPSVLTADSFYWTADSAVKIGDMTESNMFDSIAEIIGRENRFDALHIDSAHKTRCDYFLTPDGRDIINNREELERLLGIRFFHVPAELDAPKPL